MAGDNKAHAALDALRKSVPQHGFDGQALRRALHLTVKQPHGFSRDDVERVEAFWGTTNGDLDQYQFVLSLSDGRRIHLSYRSVNFATTVPADSSFSIMGASRIPKTARTSLIGAKTSPTSKLRCSIEIGQILGLGTPQLTY